MTCTIMQPTYLPWLGYFDLMDQCDVFVFYDDVQIVKRYWDVRNRIKTAQGELYLTVPIKKTQHRDDTFFTNAELDYSSNWNTKHLRTIEANYKKTAYFNEVMPFISELLQKEHTYLADLNTAVISGVHQKLNLTTELVYSSQLSGIEGKKDARLTAVCKAVNAQTYISPPGAAPYIEEHSPGGILAENGIDVYYHQFSHPEYQQQYPPFISHLCILDALFNEGFDGTKRLINLGRTNPIHYSEFRKTLHQS